VVKVGTQGSGVAGDRASRLDREVPVLGVVNAAAGVVGGVAGYGAAGYGAVVGGAADGAAAEHHRAVVPDGSAVGGSVARQRAIRDGRGLLVGVENAAAEVAGVAGDAAAADGQRPRVVDGTAKAAAVAAAVGAAVGVVVREGAVDDFQGAGVV